MSEEKKKRGRPARSTQTSAQDSAAAQALGEAVNSAVNLAKLVANKKERYAGLRNLGGPIWITDRTGAQTRLGVGDAMVVDQATLERIVTNYAAWKDGRLMRDDSILQEYELPASPVPASPNLMTDADISQLLSNEKTAIAKVNNLTSLFVLSRIKGAAEKTRKHDVFDACEYRIFLLTNKLPENFEKLDLTMLKHLLDSTNIPVEIEPGDDAEIVRGKIVSILQ